MNAGQTWMCSMATTIAFWATAASGATRVEIVVDDPVPDRKVSWPVTTGVPFPRGALQALDQVRLTDDTGAGAFFRPGLRRPGRRLCGRAKPARTGYAG